VVRGGAAGTYVYALSPGRHELRVFDATEGLDPVNVIDRPEFEIPELSYSPYEEGFDGEPTVLPAQRVVSPPGIAFAGDAHLRLPSVGGVGLRAQRLRGEVWEHIIEASEGGERPSLPFGIDGEYRPTGCDPTQSDRCVQPEGDDETWFVYMSRMDGKLQMVEAIRRGVPVHRMVQTHSEVDLRGTTLDKPRLSLRGRSVSLGNNLPPGHAFLGPLLQEPLEDKVEDVSPATYRRYGVWPVADPEQVATEVWSLTYEGIIPNASGLLGALDGADELHDSDVRFCDEGVQEGDWLTITAPVGAVDPALAPPVIDVMAGDAKCAVLPAAQARIDVPVVEVGETWVRVDTALARLRPEEPVLDESTIQAEKLASLSNCQAALDDLRLRLTSGDANLVATDALSSSTLPMRFAWELRAASSWIAVGSRSGLLHRQRWDSDAQACVLDDTMDARYEGRLATVELAQDAYSQCPPSLEQIGVEKVEEFAGSQAHRLSTFSLDLQVFPGCLADATGQVLTHAPQRDTKWSFNLYGPDNPKTVSAQSVLLGARIGAIDVRRHLVQLDTSGGKAHILQVRPGIERLLKTFE